MQTINKSNFFCIDYSVSNEQFELLYNKEKDMFETKPKPNKENLANYYQSEAYISHTDSDKTIIEKLYKFVKSFTIKSKVNLIQKLNTEEKNLLDIGCGTGDFLVEALKKSWIVTGVEPSIKAKKLAGKKLNCQSQIFSDIDEIKNSTFDVITLWHVLEHVYDLDLFLKKIKELLKPNGIIIVAVPNFKSYDAKYYKQYWAAYDVPRHLWHFSKEAIKSIFFEINMQVVQVLPMYFDSFYVSLLSEKYKTGKTRFVNGFFIGLLSNITALYSKQFSSQIFIIKNK